MEGPPTAVVTGGTSGIGAEVSAELVRRGYRVVIVGRDATRVRAHVERLRALPGPRAPDPVVADLSRIAGARAAAESIASAHPRVALLVNNAGAIYRDRGETDEGHERTIALNVLAPFVLTRGLAQALDGAAPGARVVNVASAAHLGQRLDLADMEGRRRYRGYTSYGRSKLALIELTYAFARRSPAARTAFLAVHPGLVRTRFGQGNGGLLGWLLRAGLLLGRSPARGARTVIYAATAPELAGRTAVYVDRGAVASSSSRSYDVAEGEALWSWAEHQTEAAGEGRRAEPGNDRLGGPAPEGQIRPGREVRR